MRRGCRYRGSFRRAIPIGPVLGTEPHPVRNRSEVVERGAGRQVNATRNLPPMMVPLLVSVVAADSPPPATVPPLPVTVAAAATTTPGLPPAPLQLTGSVRLPRMQW